MGSNVNNSKPLLHFEARGPKGSLQCLDNIKDTFTDDTCPCFEGLFEECDRIEASGFKPYDQVRCAQAMMCRGRKKICASYGACQKSKVKKITKEIEKLEKEQEETQTAALLLER